MAARLYFISNCSDLGLVFEENFTSFSVIHVNIRSIKKYCDQSLVCIRDIMHLAEVFVLTEINISEIIPHQFRLSGYQEHYFTILKRRGGGVAVFIKSRWSSLPAKITFTTAESLSFALELSGMAITLVVVDRPHQNMRQSFTEELKENLEHLPSYSNLCLIGDFNIDTFKLDKTLTIT